MPGIVGGMVLTEAARMLANNLAVLLDRAKRTTEAVRVYAELLELRIKQLGAEHPHVLQYAITHGKYLRSDGQIDEARGHDQPGRIDGAIGFELAAHLAEGDDAPRRDGQIADRVVALLPREHPRADCLPDVLRALDTGYTCTGAVECAEKVRKASKYGADVIKITATGGVLSNVAGGLGQQMDNSMKMFNGSEVATMLLVFMALVALADRASAWLRRALV